MEKAPKSIVQLVTFGLAGVPCSTARGNLYQTPPRKPSCTIHVQTRMWTSQVLSSGPCSTAISLSINFVEAAPGLIDNTEDALPGLLVDYTDKEKLVSVDIRMASKHTRANFQNTAVHK